MMDDDDYSFETRARKRNIFDDDVSEDAARVILYTPGWASDDDENEGGKTADRPHDTDRGKKAHIPDLSSLATPASTSRHPQSSNEGSRAMSNSASFGGASRAIGFGQTKTHGHTRSQSLTFGAIEPDTSLSRLKISNPPVMSTSLQSIDEDSKNSSRVGHGSLPVSASDIDKMQQEIQSLKRSLLSAKKDKWVKQPIEDTLRQILKGEAFSLEMYKSLSDKLKLLDLATKSHDGNAITMAVLFLKKTVTNKIFNRELVQRRAAANHYLTYLRAHYDHAEYIETLMLLGRTEEAAIYKYQMTFPTKDASVKISKLKDSLRSHFQTDPSLSTDSSLLQEHIDLLERQRPIDESDTALEASGRSVLFKDFPRKRALVDMPVVTTLYYCCLYHYDLGENSLASPAALKKRHQIAEKQYTWTAIASRAKLKRWQDIENILTTKGWFGGTKMRAVIGFDRVAGILHRNGAPQDILHKYLGMVDNPEVRLNLAKKFVCPMAIIDAFVALKNKPDLEQYASKLDRYSKEGLHAFDVLHSPNVKWR